MMIVAAASAMIMVVKLAPAVLVEFAGQQPVPVVESEDSVGCRR